ncbi:anti-sigma factor [Pedobacter sp. KBW06]|uniref:FecR family protein n=1 Tax=Pedobacter sp. KBW06 TaxID=2153359 RepID=UPI000F59DFD0|nr:FecR domain-containing protein [Pedobacter sp. KBW06]RQO72250.1 anti-sigma factor [Pedobacter sp. KBW06]
MQNKEAKALLAKYKQRNCSEEEIALLESWYLDYTDEMPDLSPGELISAKAEVWAGLPVHQQGRKTSRLWSLIAAAAAIVLCVAAGWWFFQTSQNVKPLTSREMAAKILPGGNKAVLTLADGSEISLTDVANGKLASQEGMVITKNKDGQLEYRIDPAAGAVAGELRFNTVSTPAGGQYQVILPDGTKVWLNAGSSLKYPTAFAAQERKVFLRGEGYFEVTHDQSRPFRVQSDDQVVEVLGTHFNISAYENDGDVKTTLLSGKVQVKTQRNNASAILKPGEQSILENNTLKVAEVMTEDVVAWKNNSFAFNNEKLGSIMRKIARWYDVEVICPPELAESVLVGSGSRDKSLGWMLDRLEEIGAVHFKVEGRRVTVMP